MIGKGVREMYNKLDNYLMEFSGENSSDDYWFDIGSQYASKLLNEFKNEDWEEMKDHLDEKNTVWKKRLVYCLGNDNNDQEIDIVMGLIDINDEELFVMCIDALREMITTDNKNRIASPQIIERASELISKSGLASKKVLEIFIQRITCKAP